MGTRRWTGWLGLVAAAAAACTASTASPAEPPSPAGGKADLAEAQPLELGDVVTGSVAGTAFTLFRLELQPGHRIQVIVRRISGDFDPRTVLYDASYEEISHVADSFRRSERGNVKEFLIPEGASVVWLVVKANDSSGQGTFILRTRCTGGPCLGEPPPPPVVTNEMRGICMSRARACAFEQLSRGARPDDAAVARALLQGCLAEEESSEPACTPDLCDDEDGEASGLTSAELCGTIAEALVFYGQRSDGCRETFTDCLETCTEYEENSPFLEYDEDELAFWMVGESICWDHRFGIDCDGLARDHEACGGTRYGAVEGVDTPRTCYARWRATAGAWSEYEDDQLDCGDSCDAAYQRCVEQCPVAEDGCFETCLDEADEHSVCGY